MSNDKNERYVLLLDIAKYFPDGKVPDGFKHMSLPRLKKRIKYLRKNDINVVYNINDIISESILAVNKKNYNDRIIVKESELASIKDVKDKCIPNPFSMKNLVMSRMSRRLDFLEYKVLIMHYCMQIVIWEKQIIFKMNEREETNMIILGYPCIGKTTLAQRDSKVIDLESSNFSINGAKPEGWHEIYCKVAIDLYQQGKIVFISQHKEVQDYMASWLQENPDELVVVSFPAPWLKSEWCRRSKRRYEESQDEKDLRAYERIEKCFDSDIKNLEQSPLPKMVIPSEFAYISNMIDSVIKNHEDRLKRKAEEESEE